MSLRNTNLIPPKEVNYLYILIIETVDIILKENRKLNQLENILNKGTDIMEALY